VLLEPGFPAYCAGRLLRAGIAPLAHGASHFARQPERENSPVHSTLLEPDPRQLARGEDLRASDILHATGWASLDDLHQAPRHLLLGYGLQRQVRRHKRHQGKPGQKVQHDINQVMKLRRPEN